MSAAATAAIRLKRTFHEGGLPVDLSGRRRNTDPSEPAKTGQRGHNWAIVVWDLAPVVDSPAFRADARFSRSFPQLWKKLWKSLGFWRRGGPNPTNHRSSGEAKES
jgi:hypothetical protein